MTSGKAELTVNTFDMNEFNAVFNTLNGWLMDIPDGCEMYIEGQPEMSDDGIIGKIDFYGVSDNFQPVASELIERAKNDTYPPFWNELKKHDFSVRFNFMEKGKSCLEEASYRPEKRQKSHCTEEMAREN